MKKLFIALTLTIGMVVSSSANTIANNLSNYSENVEISKSKVIIDLATMTKSEIIEALRSEDDTTACFPVYFNGTSMGNWCGTNLQDLIDFFF
jgi:hypothetical protein